MIFLDLVFMDHLLILYANRSPAGELISEDSLLVSHVFWFDSDFHNSVTLFPDHLSAGIYRLTAVLESAQDQNAANNRISRCIAVLNRSTTLHFNEIKFLTHDAEPEWIEIINSGKNPIFLKY